jgi:CheY-like chemotaxis protein
MTREILVVDDDREDVEFLEQAFAEIKDVRSISIKSFSNYFDVIKHLKTSGDTPSLIITDYNMPNITGFNLATYFKRNESFSSIPVVVLSGTIDETEKLRLLHAGVLKIYSKPQEIEGYIEIAKELVEIVHPYA